MVESASRARARLRTLVALAAAVVPVIAGAGPLGGAPGDPPGDAPDDTAATAAPAAFALPLDAGTRAVRDLARARADLPKARAEAERWQARRIDLDDRWSRLMVALDQARDAEHTAAAAAEAGSARVRDFAVRAYVNGSTGEVAAALRAFEDSTGVLDLYRDLQIIEHVGSDAIRNLARQREVHRAARQRVDELVAARDELALRRDDAGQRFAAALVAVDDATRRIADAEARIERFHRAATSSASPILGPSRLSAEQLASFVTRSGHTPRATVPIRELAAIFLDEGAAEGVRGDVAFAQSILETGWFTFPDGGMVRPEDNNFAGIGACDTCERGYSFATARTGVRAQIQLLRTYADAEVDAGGFAHGALLPRALGLGFRGDVRTWSALGGRWATGDGYGERVYAIYRQMVSEAGYP